MAIKFANNIKTTLSSGITGVNTLITVGSTADFPALSASDYFYATLVEENETQNSPREVVKVTAISGNNLTVERGQDGTSAISWVAGSTFEIRIPRIALSDMLALATRVQQQFEVTATASQTVFTVPGLDYEVGVNNLWVFRNGAKLRIVDDYTETSTDTITLTSGANDGDVFEFITNFTATSLTTQASGVAITDTGSHYSQDNVEAALQELGSSSGSSIIGYTPAGTGAVASNVQTKLREFVSAKDFGADSAASAAVNTVAIQAAINALSQNGTLDLNGGTYNVNAAIVVNKRMILQNGVLNQTTETENTLEVPGPLTYGPTLKNVGLTHDFVTASAGSLLDLSSGGPLGFFEWDGCLGICGGGYYGVRSHGGTWMMSFKRIYITNIYSSGFYLPASGDVVSNSQLGGSTTTYLQNCFVSDIQTVDPAYAIGTGYDNVRLETCAADSVSCFGYFKAQPLSIVNCYSEKIRNPPVGTLSGPHRYIVINSGQGITFDGFSVSFDAGFVAPAPGGGNVNSLVYCNGGANLYYAGARGSLPSGYYMLDQESGQAIVNSATLGSGVRTITNANYSAPNYSTASLETPYTLNRTGDLGDVAEFQYAGTKYGSITTAASNSFDIKAAINSASIRLGSKNSGGTEDFVFWNANVPAFFPATDNTPSCGRSAYRWSVIYAGTGTINTSDEREKQDIAALDDAEKRVAVALKGLVKKYRFKDAVQSKGDDARIHVGVIAQEVIAAFQAESLDASRYGILCYDEWDAELDEDGNEVRPAGNRYGVRYEELLAFIIAAL